LNKDLYTELVMEHAQNKSNHRDLEDASHIERGFNPSCGDDLTLLVKISDGVIEDASYIGDGCAISKAAISMMIDQVKGKNLEEAEKLATDYLNMIKGETVNRRDLGNLFVFENLKNMPARVKCGTLGMHCLKVVIDQ